MLVMPMRLPMHPSSLQVATSDGSVHVWDVEKSTMLTCLEASSGQEISLMTTLSPREGVTASAIPLLREQQWRAQRITGPSCHSRKDVHQILSSDRPSSPEPAVKVAAIATPLLLIITLILASQIIDHP